MVWCVYVCVVCVVCVCGEWKGEAQVARHLPTIDVLDGIKDVTVHALPRTVVLQVKVTRLDEVTGLLVGVKLSVVEHAADLAKRPQTESTRTHGSRSVTAPRAHHAIRMISAEAHG